MVVVFVVASETLKKQMVKKVNNIYWELGSWGRGCMSRLQVVEAAAKLARYTGHNDNIL